MYLVYKCEFVTDVVGQAIMSCPIHKCTHVSHTSFLEGPQATQSVEFISGCPAVHPEDYAHCSILDDLEF